MFGLSELFIFKKKCGVDKKQNKQIKTILAWTTFEHDYFPH